MPVFEQPLAFALALAPGIAGVGAAAWILRDEKRLPVVAGGGFAAGTGMMVCLHLALLRWLDPQAAAIASQALAGLGAIWSAAYLARRRRFIWKAAAAWTFFAIALLSLVTIGAVVDFSASVWNGSTHENLALRMPMTAHMARGDWPIKDVYAPEHERLYRYAAQAWAASLMRASGTGLFAATLAITTVSVWAITGGLFAAIALLRGYRAGLLGALLFFMAGPANVLAIWNAPAAEATVSKAYALAAAKRDLLSGFVLSHGFGLLPGNDYTIVVALGAAAGGAFLTAALWQPARRRAPAAIGAAVCFGGMAASAEQTFPVALAGLATAAAMGMVAKRSTGFWMVAVAAGAVALALVVDGPLRSIALGSEPGRRANFGFTPQHVFTFPTAAMLYEPSASRFFQTPQGAMRVGWFDPIALKELGWLYLGLAAAPLLAAFRRRPQLLPYAASAIAALAIPGLVSDFLYPSNVGRFTSLAIPLSGLVVGLVSAELLDVRRRPLGGLARVLALALLVVTGGSWIATVPLWPAKVYDSANAHLREDLEAAEFARSLPYGRRALVLPGPVNQAEINSDDWEGMHKFAVSFGTLFVPLGFDEWGNVAEYQPHYRRAYGSLDPEAMDRLKIDVVYTAPRLFTPEQRAMVEGAVQAGRLTPAFESSGGSRRIYIYRGGRDGG